MDVIFKNFIDLDNQELTKDEIVLIFYGKWWNKTGLAQKGSASLMVGKIPKK